MSTIKHDQPGVAAQIRKRRSLKLFFFCSSQHHLADDFSLLYSARPFVKEIEGKSIRIAPLSNLVSYFLLNRKLLIMLSLPMTRPLCELWEPVAPDEIELFVCMLRGSTIYPRFEKIFYFYKVYQPRFREMQRFLPDL